MKDNVIDNISNTVIKKSDIHGEGLFSTNDITKNSVLCLLDGQYLSYTFVKKVQSKQTDKEGFLNLEWNQINNDLLLVRIHPTKYRYINHSRNPNCRVLKEPMRLVAIKNISNGEELTLDYREEELGDEYLLDHGISYL